MPTKPRTRNWNDIQTAITTAAIVTTIGLWNLFAIPEKTVIVQAKQPTILPLTEPPIAAEEPVSMPQVKIMFTPEASQGLQILAAQQPQPQIAAGQQSQPQIKKKKKNNNNSVTQSVTQTKSS